jgi:hypothetical protein
MTLASPSALEPARLGQGDPDSSSRVAGSRSVDSALDHDLDLDLLIGATQDHVLTVSGSATASRADGEGALSDPEISAWLDDRREGPGSRAAHRIADLEIEAQISALDSDRGHGSITTSSVVRPTDHGDEDYLEAQAGLHAALLYRGEDELVREIAAFLGHGLVDGDVAVIVATPERVSRIGDALPADVLATAQRQGRLVVLDARETLAGFLRGGDVDAAAFERRVAVPFRELTRGSSWVTAYGEMTTLLWAAGDVTGALRLEQLWTDLQRDVPFSLLCAYPSSDAAYESGGIPELCDAHTRVHSPA